MNACVWGGRIADVQTKANVILHELTAFFGLEMLLGGATGMAVTA